MGDEKINDRVLGYLHFDITHLDLEIVRIYFQFVAEKISNVLNVRPDLSSESFFWRRAYHQHYIEYPHDVIYPRAKETKESIIRALIALKERYQEPFSCLDVGCGPASQFYSEDFQNNPAVCIVTVDPLAEVYGELHKRYNTGYDLVCIPGYGEKLTELFPKEEFHLAYSQNAIDHSQDPRKIIDNLHAVLKPHGFLILHGFVNEGSAANWLGLHKWNIETNGVDLFLSNRDGSIARQNMTGHLNLNLFYSSVEGNEIGDKYTIIYEKI